MAAETRRATRRDPIEVTVELPDGTEVTFVARPMPWRIRTEFGDFIIHQFSGALNKALTILRDPDSEMIGLEGDLVEKNTDYPAVFVYAYSTYKVDDDGEVQSTPPSPKDVSIFSNLLEFEQMIVVLDAAWEVNALDRLGHLLDPRKKDPTIGGSEDQPETTDDGEKMESPTDSG